ncbi:MAG: cohesin domain-containing protein, partial [Chloroflexota bacterium]
MRVALCSVALLVALSLLGLMPDPHPAAARGGLLRPAALSQEAKPAAQEAVELQVSPVLLRFWPLQIPPVDLGGSTGVQLLLENTDPLFGVDLTVTFDSGRLAATEIASGDLLPNARVVKRDIDNAAGTVRYVATLLGDAVPIASTGVVASIRFDALAVGSAPLEWVMERVKLSDRESNPLVGRPEEVTLVVAGPTATRTPRPTATEAPAPPASNPPAPEPTSTAHPTHTPRVTRTPRPTATHVPGATPMEGTALPTATAAALGSPYPTGGPLSPWDTQGWTAHFPLPTPGPLTGVVFPPEPPSGIPPVQGDGFVALLEPTPGVGVVKTSLGDASVEIRVDNMGGSVALRFQPLDDLPEGVVLPPDTGVARVFSLDLYGYEPESGSAHRIVYGEGRGSAPIVLRWGLSEEEYNLTLDDRGVPHPDRLAFYRLTSDGRLVRLSAAWGPEPAPHGSVATVFVDRSTFLLAVLPPEQAGRTVPVDPRYFPETGFRVGGDSFWDYFNRRGGLGSFGYPISREFTLSGFRVQMFQRAVFQALPDGSVATMNLLDGGMMPYTRINSSSFPVADPELAASAPPPSDPD